MKPRARYLLAVTLIATALCASRAAAVAPASRAEPGQLDLARLAERLVARLSDGFRQTVTPAHWVVARRPGVPVTTRRVAPTVTPLALAAQRSPLHRPLPPPVV